MNLADEYPARSGAEQELFIQQQLTEQARRFAETQTGPAHACAHNLQLRLALDNQFLTQTLEAPDGAPTAALHQYLQLLEQQRSLLHQLNQRPDFDEEVIR